MGCRSCAEGLFHKCGNYPAYLSGDLVAELRKAYWPSLGLPVSVPRTATADTFLGQPISQHTAPLMPHVRGPTAALCSDVYGNSLRQL